MNRPPCQHDPPKLGYNPTTKQVFCSCGKTLTIHKTMFCIACLSRHGIAGTQEIGNDIYYVCGKCAELTPIRVARIELKNVWS